MQYIHFDQITPGIWAALPVLWIALSVAYRRRFDKPILALARPGSVFIEGWASARTGIGLASRLGTARNCMHVQVTDSALHIHPHFPFTLGFMPELYDLDQVIALDKIRSASILGGNRAKAVEVTYLKPGGDEGVLQLLLKNAELFIHAVHARRRDTIATG